eukprot:IDg12468t1
MVRMRCATRTQVNSSIGKFGCSWVANYLSYHCCMPLAMECMGPHSKLPPSTSDCAFDSASVLSLPSRAVPSTRAVGGQKKHVGLVVGDPTLRRG